MTGVDLRTEDLFARNLISFAPARHERAFARRRGGRRDERGGGNDECNERDGNDRWCDSSDGGGGGRFKGEDITDYHPETLKRVPRSPAV